METKTKWHSCRLTVHDSGRVRWCVGQEKQWPAKLKRLVFVPAILLTLVIICMLITRIFTMEQELLNREIDESPFDDTYEENFEMQQRKERHIDIFKFMRTRFIESTTQRNVDANRQKRDAAPANSDDDIVIEDGENIHLDVNDDEGEIFSVADDYNVAPQSFWKDQVLPEEVRRMQAKTMRMNMDSSMDPCVDFYQHACGNWAQNNPIPADRAGYDTFEMLRENLDGVLRDLLEDRENNEELIPVGYLKNEERSFKQRRHVKTIRFNDSDSLRADADLKAKYMYKSCMNEKLLRERGAAPLVELLDELGGWPMTDLNWKEENFDFIRLLAELRLYNNDILISEWIGPDIKNSNEYIIQIDQTTLGLPTREYFIDPINSRYVEAYRMYMMTIASLLGSPILVATSDSYSVVDFETELAEITAAPEMRRNVSQLYRRVTINQLHSFLPQIDWARYMTIVMEKNINSSEPVVCYCWGYLYDLVDLLGRTPPRTIANYLLWRFVRHRVNNLDDRFEEAKQRFYHVLFGREKSPPRWQSCISQVNSNLGMALGSMFVRKYFDETSKNDTLMMTTQLQQSFRELLSNTKWLDYETRQLARMKIDAMGLRIGYPDFILDKYLLAMRYFDVHIHPDYYFENTLSILQHLTRVEQHRLGTNVNKTLWNTAPAVVNAYYSRNKNQIMFPAGILQPPFYHRYFPKCLNYGGIGVVIGHEITHGFDDKGRLFDKEGNLQKWWKHRSVEEFHERSQCLINQYNNYVVPEVNLQVDGLNTQGENIADNGGIKQAFRAYSHWLSENPDADETLPELNITSKQLFFLNFAQVWCGSARPEATKNKLKTAVHSPGRFRVIGTLSNSQDFADVYMCPKGSPMNPAFKCSIW